MKKTLKLFVVLMVLVGAGYLAASFWIGNIIENEWNRQIDTLSTQYPSIEFEISSYDKGLFSSTVSSKLSFPLFKSSTEEPPIIPSISLTSHIKHGPIIVGAGQSPALLLMQSQTSLADDSEMLAEINQEFPELLEITTHEQITFGWQYSGHMEIPAIEKEFAAENDMLTVNFAGLNADYRGQLKPRITMQLDLSMPMTAMKSADGINAEVKNLSVKADLQEVIAYLYEGTSKISLESLIVQGTAEDAPSVNLEGLELTADINVDGDMLEEVVAYNLNKLSLNEDIYGPMHMELAVSNLDTVALSNIQGEFQKLPIGAMLDDETKQFTEQSINTLKKPFLNILKKSPKFEIRNLSMQTPYGKVIGKGQCQLDGEQVNSLEQPALLIAALTAGMDISIDKVLLQEVGKQYVLKALESQDLAAEEKQKIAAQQSEQSIAGLTSANYLIDTGQAYQLQAEFDRGSFSVNGQKMQ